MPAPADGSGAEVAAARDRAVAAMLAQSPAVVDYLRRAVLDLHGERGDLVSKLSALTADQVGDLRRRGIASARGTIGEQVLTIMIRQLGQVFLQPLADRIVDEFGAGPDASPPRIVVRLEGRREGRRPRTELDRGGRRKIFGGHVENPCRAPSPG